MEDLQALKESGEQHSEDSGEPGQEILPELCLLYEKNPELIGWLKIPNTKIDYPVMHTPADPDFYLHHTFDGSNSRSGTPFLDGQCDMDSDCIIIYGHNMKNGTMFGTLDNYADAAFQLENRVFSFDTIYDKREYEVFAAIRCQVLPQDEEGFRYYYQAGDLDENSFDALVQWLTENALYQTDIKPVFGDQILLLSTCSYHQKDGRFLVAARRIQNN